MDTINQPVILAILSGALVAVIAFVAGIWFRSHQNTRDLNFVRDSLRDHRKDCDQAGDQLRTRLATLEARIEGYGGDNVRIEGKLDDYMKEWREDTRNILRVLSGKDN